MELEAKDIETTLVEGGIVLWFLGGPSLAIRTSQSLVYLDLFTGPSPAPEIITKAIPQAIDPQAIRWADMAISTHFDEDHCDWHALGFLHKNTSCLFLGPVSCNKLYAEWGFDLARRRQIAAYECFAKRDIAIHAYPSKDAYDPDAVTYVIEAGGVRLLDSGDTLHIPELAQIGREWDLDIAFLSYARSPADKVIYMDEEAILKAAEDLKAKMVILKHYDLWVEFSVDPGPLLKKLKAQGHDARVFGLGERFVYRGEA